MTLPSLLRRVVDLLDERAIPYMLTGSLAGAYYSTPRATQDVDIVVDASRARLVELADDLVESGFYASTEAVREAVDREGQFNAIDPESGWKVDFIVRKSRPFSVEEFARRRAAEVLGIDLSLASPEDLVITKLEWAKEGGSEVQLRDVRSILRARGERLDHRYIERWVGRLGVTKLWREALKTVDG